MSNPISDGENTLKIATFLQAETGYPPDPGQQGSVRIKRTDDGTQ